MVGRQPLTDEHRRLVRLDVGCIGLIQPGFFRSLLGAAAAVHVANGFGLLDEAHELIWRKVALMTELLQPVLLLSVGQAFLDPADRGRESVMLWRARTIRTYLKMKHRRSG